MLCFDICEQVLGDAAQALLGNLQQRLPLVYSSVRTTCLRVFQKKIHNQLHVLYMCTVL